MKITFPYKNGLREVEMPLITLNNTMAYYFNLERMGYPYKYFKRN